MDCVVVRLGIFLMVAVQQLPAQGYLFQQQDDDKRQDLVPFPRVGRQALVPFPRVGKRQGLIPFPRIGRAFDEAEDYYLDPEDDVAYFLLPYKRSPMTFTPRIGRKKRSAGDSDDASETDDRLPHPWQMADWAEMERVLRQLIPAPRVGREEGKRGAFTPRIGRAPFTPRIGRRADPTLNVRAAFTPRIGRGNA